MAENLNESQKKIVDILDNMQNLLLYKNEKYGDAILSKDGQIFFKGDAKERVAMHLDEKIGRIKNNPDPEPRKNDVMDLIGYCVFELIVLGATKDDFKKEMD